MKVNFDYATNETVVRLNEIETERLTGLINREVHGSADPEMDKTGQLEDALTDLFT